MQIELMKIPNQYVDNKGNAVKVLGMLGLSFSNKEKEEYFVDSEILVGSEYNIVLFKDMVRHLNSNGEKVSEAKRKEVIDDVLEILKLNNVKTMLL